MKDRSVVMYATNLFQIKAISGDITKYIRVQNRTRASTAVSVFIRNPALHATSEYIQVTDRFLVNSAVNVSLKKEVS